MGERITPVILCGGAGTRLWPASREELPKPFLPLVDGVSTFAGTIARVADPALFDPPIVIGNRGHGALITAALGQAGSDGTVLLEPLARDTAPAIAAAAAFAEQESPGSLLLILAADHLIGIDLIDDRPVGQHRDHRLHALRGFARGRKHLATI